MNLHKWIDQQDFEVQDIDVANFKKRNYMNFRDESFSAKVKEIEKYNAKLHTANICKELRNFIRIMLIKPGKKLISKLDDEYIQMRKEDYSQIVSDISKGEIKLTDESLKEMPPKDQFILAECVSWMDRSDVRNSLGLTEVVSTKLIGYEKEIFVLKCMKHLILPVIWIRLAIRLIGKGYSFEDQIEIPLCDLV